MQEQKQWVHYFEEGTPSNLFIYPLSKDEQKSLKTPEFKEVFGFGPDDIVFVINEVKAWKTSEIRDLLEKIGICTSTASFDDDNKKRVALLKLFPIEQDYFCSCGDDKQNKVLRVYQIRYYEESKEVDIYENGKYTGGYVLSRGQLLCLQFKSKLFDSFYLYDDGKLTEHRENFNDKNVGKWYTSRIRLQDETNPGMVCVYFIDGNNVSTTEYNNHLNDIKKACIVSFGNDLAEVIVSFV